MSENKQLKHNTKATSVPKKGAAGLVYIPVRVIKRAHEVVFMNTHQLLADRLSWYESWHQNPKHRRVHLAVLSVYVAAAVVALIGFGRVANAFDNWIQSDWSGGQGTNTSSQYETVDNIETATQNQLTMGSNTISDWCNDPGNCDSDWQYRKLVNINSDQARTDYPVKFTVPYNGNMKSDFADLRFTLQDGTVLPMWHENMQSSTSDEVYVKIPALIQGVTNVYMYYGNAAAYSVSNDDTFSFNDEFSGNSVDTNKWSVDGAISPAVSVSDGALHFDNTGAVSGGYGNFTPSFNTIDRNDQMRFEYSLSVDSLGNSSDNTCAYFGPNLFNVIDWGNAVDQHGTNFACESGQQDYYYGSFGNFLDGQGYNLNPTDMQHTPYGNPNWYRRFAIEATSNSANHYVSNGWTNWDKYTIPNTPSMTRSPLAATFYVGSAYANTKFNLGYVRIYRTGATTQTYMGLEQTQGGAIGSLTSAAFQAGTQPYYGTVTIASTGSGLVGIKVRTATNSDMNDAQGFDTCPLLLSGDPIASSSCVGAGQHFLQYELYMSQASGGDIAVQNLSFEYLDDPTGPGEPSNIVVKRSSTGPTVAEGNWTNTQNPYMSWDAASDNVGGSGVMGYCLYLGNNNTDDPMTTKGNIVDLSPLNTGGLCQYATVNSNIDFSQVGHSSFNNGETIYLTIRSIDYAGNVSSGSVQTSFRYEDVAPQAFTVFNPPPTAANSAIISTTWTTLGTMYDNDSGFAGFKYCVTNLANLGLSGCDASDSNWYGINHSSGVLEDTSDVFPFANGAATTTQADAARMDLGGAFATGVNRLVLRAVDNAGNSSMVGESIIIITQHPAGAPTNLTVSPGTNTQNAFSFNWDAPGFFIGGTSTINYCWSVNEPIAQNGSNCHWTGKGITSLASGAYATLQGTNIMYISAKDDTGNFDGTQAATVSFTANTSAPGAPTNLDVSDASIKATSTWKLAMSWTAPNLVGDGIASYKILRSTDNVTFAEVGSTSPSNLSFVDTGLSQQVYYYQIKACDDANSCSVGSNVSSKRPTGKYTTPANLTSDIDQPRAEDIGTRKARIIFFTDRESDSRVAIGTTSGQYAQEEIGNSSQVLNHSVSLDNLNPGTKYYAVAKWTDVDGNTGVSPEFTFTTLPAPVVKEASAVAVNVDRATVRFTISAASQAKLYYGKSENFGGIKSINTSSRESVYDIDIADLSDGTKFFFRIDGVDSDGNQYSGNIYTFTTLERPRIQNLRFQPIDGEPTSTQKVTWQTNVASSSEIIFGIKDAKQTEAINSGLVTDHEMIMRDLEDDSEYSLVARSRDNLGNVATTSVQIFRTALDTRPPKISDVSIEVSMRGTGAAARGQVIVSWKTDELSTSAVAYGVGTNGSALTTQTAEDSKMTKDHVVVVSDLTPASVYQIKAVSYDKARNKSMSEAQAAIVGRATENVLSIIFSTLSRIFGFGG